MLNPQAVPQNQKLKTPHKAKMEQQKKFQLKWVVSVLFNPGQIFPQITAQKANTWLAPLLILTVTGLIVVLFTGMIQQKNASDTPLPPGFEYLTPEQQAQYTQAAQLRQGPIFRFIFPAVSVLTKVWVGWLLISGILHLFLTMMGGRASAGVNLAVVAWSGLPYAVRELVRIIYLLLTQRLIKAPGLSGFVNAEEGGTALFLAGFLALVDIYLLWNILLLIVGVRSTSGLSKSKAAGTVLVTVLVVILFQTLLSYASASLSNMTIMRMFF